MKEISGAYIVSFNFSENNNCVLIVGEQRKRGNVNIINAFSGEEAMNIYKLLTEKKEN